MKPKNPNIKISPLGKESKFISGSKKWTLDYAIFEGNTFKKDIKVSWYCEDYQKLYTGKIEYIIITESGSVEVSIDCPSIGRLDLEELEII